MSSEAPLLPTRASALVLSPSFLTKRRDDACASHFCAAGSYMMHRKQKPATCFPLLFRYQGKKPQKKRSEELLQAISHHPPSPFLLDFTLFLPSYFPHFVPSVFLLCSPSISSSFFFFLLAGCIS